MIETHENTLAIKLRNAALPFVAARLKLARLELNVTQDELARRMGKKTRHHIIKLEQGLHRPTVHTLELYAEATGKPADWFVEADDGA